MKLAHYYCDFVAQETLTPSCWRHSNVRCSYLTIDLHTLDLTELRLLSANGINIHIAREISPWIYCVVRVPTKYIQLPKCHWSIGCSADKQTKRKNGKKNVWNEKYQMCIGKTLDTRTRDSLSRGGYLLVGSMEWIETYHPILFFFFSFSFGILPSILKSKQQMATNNNA